jgi:NTE family protein
VRAAGDRALVLGGGGSTGNAWLIGAIAGLYDAGLDVTDADLVIGTSAGSTAAAQIAGASPTDLLAAVLDAPPRLRTGPLGSNGGRVPVRPAADHMLRTGKIIAAAEDAADMRRRMGASALDLDAASDGTAQARWHATVAARLPSQRWPHRTVLVPAVDAHTGAPVLFDRHSGVDPVDAVAASCASSFAYRIADNRVRQLLGRATTKVEPLPGSSPSSGEIYERPFASERTSRHSPAAKKPHVGLLAELGALSRCRLYRGGL